MSGEEEKKKRRWGKTKSRPKEDITVISKDVLEDTLSKCKQEAKEALEKKSRSIVTSQERNNDGNGNPLFSAIDLQQPQLMSNERLIEALRKINVPIPVYPDGSPSRERLLYLYRTFVLPQPQRSRQQRGRKRKVGGRRKNGNENIILDNGNRGGDSWGNGDSVEEMEVETSDVITKNTEIGKKRVTSCDSQDRDLMSPIKRLLIKSPSTEAAASSLAGSSSNTAVTSTPHTNPSLPTPAINQHRIIKVKRTSTSSISSSSSTTPVTINRGTEQTNQKTKITWP